MNLGYYELMDRIAIIQCNLNDYVEEHIVASDEIKKHLDAAQKSLTLAYGVAADEWHNSCEDFNK